MNLCSTEHLGINMDIDLARLTASDPLRNIFDVGGNFGQTALQFASAFPEATIYTFEPVPTTFDRLKTAVQNNDRIEPFNIALGDTSGSTTINLTQSAGSNTLLQNDAATGSVSIQIDTLDSFAKANSIEKIDLLKIDVEGYELPVLKGAENFLQQGRVRYIFAECVLSEDTILPHTNFFDLHSCLEQYGFCFVAYYSESFRLKDGCALGNVLYALRSKLPQTVPGNTQNIA